MRAFELSVALKYLTPRWKQVSVSMISLISILVISMVVWLIVLFFSVTHGLEKNWIDKLIALTAPVRVTPSDQYYSSFYYQIDSISQSSDYSYKTIREKLQSDASDPYDPLFDEEIPAFWAKPVFDQEGKLLDPVKIAFDEINKLPGVQASDYEMTFSTLRLRLIRDIPQVGSSAHGYEHHQSFLTQNAYLGSIDPNNPKFNKTLTALNGRDVQNLLNMASVSSENMHEDSPDSIIRLSEERSAEKLRQILGTVEIKTVRTPLTGWQVPKSIFNDSCNLKACLVRTRKRVERLVLPQSEQSLEALKQALLVSDNDVAIVDLKNESNRLYVQENEEQFALPDDVPVILEGGVGFKAAPLEDSVNLAARADQLQLLASIPIQNRLFDAIVSLEGLELSDYSLLNTAPNSLWFTEGSLPSDSDFGDAILLPKNFREAGVLVGDRGFLAYHTATASSIQEQRVPVYVAGFYDPGIMPVGGKFVLASHDTVSAIRASHEGDDLTLTNGINVRFDNPHDAGRIKNEIQKAFKERGIDGFWSVQSYEEYDFTKELIRQLSSEKNLFTLLSLIILLVACSNIISMLIILVNDKKMEIGILRSMGASSFSIALIFGLCGVSMGLIGSFLGTLLALFTLHNLNALIAFFSEDLGISLFNPAFFGAELPTEVSFEAIMFVMVVTAVISAIAGIVPAIKACMLKPSEILRAE